MSHPSLAAAAVLRYEAPSECPSAITLHDEVESLLGSALADAAPIDVLVQITHGGPDDLWRVMLTVQGGTEPEPRTRLISGDSCAEVAEAAAIAAAIAIRDGEPESESSEDKVAAEPAPPHEPEKAASEPSQPAKSPDTVRAGPGIQFGVGASLLFDTATLPSLTWGLEALAFADFLDPGLRAMVFGGLLGPQEERLSDGTGGRFDLLFAGLGACGVKSFAPVSGLLCAGMEAGVLRGEGLVSEPRLGSSPWLAPRAEVGMALRLLPGFSLAVRGGAAFPLNRETFVLNGDEVVHQPESPTVRFGAGVELEL